jgi:hypothetical protein
MRATACVYRCYADDGALIYVGCTEIGLDRFSAHRSAASWFTEVATITIEHFPTRLGAYAAERKAIRSEAPIYNVKSKFRGQMLAAADERDRDQRCNGIFLH